MNKKVVVIGGGTGTYVVLSGLKKYPLDLSVIVSMMDSGGSTGRLRDQLGVLPPGDLRQCLVALSEAPELWRKLFLYRFENGDLAGHNFGNIFLTALEKITDDYQEVVETASFILKTKGRVIPVTHDQVHLCVQYEDGEVIETEAAIDKAIHKFLRITTAYLKPLAQATPKALETLTTSDYIIIGPGDLYTSLIPNLLVDKVAQTIHQARAKIIAIVNLMTKKGQTDHYTAADHINDLEKYLKRKIDIIFMNDSPIAADIVAYYGRSGEQQVRDDLSGLSNDRRVVYDNFISNSRYEKAKADTAIRSLLRHDSEKIAAGIWEILKT